jgi:two-component system, NarL family, sensor histidine kinase DesK
MSVRIPRRVRVRLGQSLGLLFLIGPLVDLLRSEDSAAQTAAILVVFAAFVALYLALLPPAGWLVRRGPRALVAGLALLAASAGLTLLLGAPGSFSALFVYVAVASGLLLPVRPAAVVIGVTALGVGIGLTVAGASSSTVASLMLTIVAIGAMMAAFARKIQANRELEAAREELARLAVSEERLRIARDLHDLLGHTLSVVALKSELAARLVDRDPARARGELEEVQEVTRHALAEVREAVHGYRRLALADAVDGARTALTAAGIDCRVEGRAGTLPDEVEDVLAWAVREATTNVVRHSDARTCSIRLQSTDGGVELEVADDGSARSTGEGGTGLRGVAERAEKLRGTLEVGARRAGGFRVKLTVPLPAS